MVENGAPVLDEHGNTLGGVRSPDVDVPIAILSGNPPAGGADLIELYPTHADYVTMVEASARAAREAGFLLEPEQQAMVEEARAAAVPE